MSVNAAPVLQKLWHELMQYQQIKTSSLAGQHHMNAENLKSLLYDS